MAVHDQPVLGRKANMRTKEPKKANPIDAYVGGRIRARRMFVGMSQDKLAEQLGLTFQQVQKYEKGANRVGAGRLWIIGRILDVPVSYFFDGLGVDAEDAAMSMAAGAGVAETRADYKSDPLSSPETIQLVQAFSKVNDPEIRKKILDLVRSLAA